MASLWDQSDRENWDKGGVWEEVRLSRERGTEAQIAKKISQEMERYCTTVGEPKRGRLWVFAANEKKEKKKSFDGVLVYSREENGRMHHIPLASIEFEEGAYQAGWDKDVRAMRQKWWMGLNVLARKDWNKWQIFVKYSPTCNSFFAIDWSTYQRGKDEGWIKFYANVSDSMSRKGTTTCHDKFSINWDTAEEMAAKQASGFAMDDWDSLCCMLLDVGRQAWREKGEAKK